MECFFKAFRRDVIDRLTIEEDRFGVEPELAAKVAQLGVRVYEVSVGYHGRTYLEGKKIGLRDGFRALFAIAKYGLVARLDAITR
jgi:ATP-dependent phosphoenolpyruvate carboxykinase